MNPLGALITAVLCILVCIASRRIAAVALVCGVCYITQGQEVNLGFHFTAMRLVLLAGLVRIIGRGELKSLQTTKIDRAVILYALGVAAISTLREGTIDELVYQAGGLYNILLSYFVCRALLQDKRDFISTLSLIAWTIIPLALLMYVESSTGRNLFAVFGGVSETSLVRDGHVRAQGPFRSPITAGAFGATFALLFISVLFARLNRFHAIVGAASAFFVVMCARSSGPLLGFLIGGIALICWRFRENTRKIRWGIIISLISLQMIMKAPVWFLLGRISDVVGGGGYHRAYLIDNFVTRFSSWWFAGTSDTADWMATELSFGGADITNQFVADGLNGGIIGLTLSIVLLVRCFQAIGSAIGNNPSHSSPDTRFAWGVGATLVGSVGILFSVTYFDQMHVIWYLLLASVAAIPPLAADTATQTPAAGEITEDQMSTSRNKTMPATFLTPWTSRNKSLRNM